MLTEDKWDAEYKSSELGEYSSTIEGLRTIESRTSATMVVPIVLSSSSASTFSAEGCDGYDRKGSPASCVYDVKREPSYDKHCFYEVTEIPI
jgi:hypothetical protein